METTIHPSAWIEPGAQLGRGVEVGAFAVVEAGARVGDGCRIGHHAVIHRGATLGERNRVYPHCVVGGEPQDLKYRGQPTLIEIGDDNMLREFTTFSRGTEEGGGVTRVGSHNLFMANTHVAHDCRVGDHVVLANCATLAGHCEVGSHAVVAGLSGIHQRVRIGTGSMIGGLSRLSKDVAPFSTTNGCDEVRVYGLNRIGLKRRGFGAEDLAALETAFRLYQDRLLNFGQALAKLDAIEPKTELVRVLVDFLKSTTRGVYR